VREAQVTRSLGSLKESHRLPPARMDKESYGCSREALATPMPSTGVRRRLHRLRESAEATERIEVLSQTGANRAKRAKIAMRD
jgi:hypothetical protein